MFIGLMLNLRPKGLSQDKTNFAYAYWPSAEYFLDILV